LTSALFAKVASRGQIFSHIGLIYCTAGDTSVLHCEAVETGEENSLRKESFCNFICEADTFAVYHLDLSDSIAEMIAERALSMCLSGARFDFSFDNSTDSLLYCTEYSAKAVNQIAGDGFISPTLSVNGRSIYSIDDMLSDTTPLQ